MQETRRMHGNVSLQALSPRPDVWREMNSGWISIAPKTFDRACPLGKPLHAFPNLALAAAANTVHSRHHRGIILAR
jgi:hypothetical protein